MQDNIKMNKYFRGNSMVMLFHLSHLTDRQMKAMTIDLLGGKGQRLMKYSHCPLFPTSYRLRSSPYK